MTRLRQRDFAALSRALEALYADADAATLSDRILASLYALFDCDFASFSLMELRRGRFHAFNLAPQVPGWPGVEVYARYLHSDPAATYIRRTRDPRAVKISDFASLREYRSSSIYTEVFGHLGCDRRMGFAMQGNSPVSLIATLNRKGRDFTEEDRGTLDLLRPHLLQAHAHAHADQLARAERDRALTRLGDTLEMGLGEVDAAGRLLWATPRARFLLEVFFPGPTGWPVPDRLPAALERRLAGALHRTRRPAPAALAPLPPPVWRFAGPGTRALQLRLIAGTKPGHWQFLLQETPGKPMPVQAFLQKMRLTPREGEIFQWLAQGKSNAAIATILGVTEKTVGKHLEHVFGKLHVENRTAAVRVVADATGRAS